MSHFHIMQVMILLVNLLVAVLLLRWPLALILAAVGILSAVYLFKDYIGLEPLLPNVITPQFKLIYGLLLFSSFLIALFRHKEAREKLEYQNVSLLTTNKETTSELLGACKDRKKFIRAFRESGATELAELASLSREIEKEAQSIKLPKKFTKKITQLHEKLSPIALHLDRLDHRAAGYMRLDTATITLDKLLGAVQDKLRDKDLAKHINWKHMTKHKEVECDVTRIASLLVNSIAFIRGCIWGGSTYLDWDRRYPARVPHQRSRARLYQEDRCA